MDQINQLNKIFNRDDAQPPSSGKTPKGQKFDIFKVDYPWIEACTDKREMRLAYESLKEDAGFPDLTATCLKKLKQLDPKFKTESDFNNYTPKEADEANADVLAFLSTMEKNDRKLRA